MSVSFPTTLEIGAIMTVSTPGLVVKVNTVDAL